MEDGKYYPMMKVKHADAKTEVETYTSSEYIYGHRVLEMRHPVLYDYLNREMSLKTAILAQLKKQDGERIAERIREIEEEIEDIKLAEQYFDCNMKLTKDTGRNDTDDL